jgi:O-antigen/teichoic acid export membrane protein
MSYIQSAARGVGIIFVMNALAYVVAYLTRLVLARQLGPEEYGLFYSVFTFIIFFLFFRDLGLGKAATKYISSYVPFKKFNKVKTVILSATSFQFISSILFGLVFFFLADTLATSYFKNPAAAPLMKILLIYILFSITFVLLKGFFSGFQKFKLYAAVDFSKNSIVLLLLLFFFSMGFGVFAPVFAYVLVGPILLVLFLPFLLKTFPFFKYKITQFKPITKKLFLFGIPVIFTGIGSKVIGYVDTLILTYFRPLAEVGIYNVVLPSAMMVLFASSSVASVVFPIFSELWAKKDNKKLVEGVRLIHKYIFLGLAPLVFALFSFSDVFLRVFFGAEYIVGSVTLRILLVGVLFFTLASINHSIISSIGRPAVVTRIILAAAGLNLLANIVFIPLWGIVGAGIATALSYGLALVLSTRATRRFIQIKIPVLAWIKTAFASLVFIGVVYLLREVIALSLYSEVVVIVTFAGLAYLALAYFLGLIDIGEIKKYWKIVTRGKGSRK